MGGVGMKKLLKYLIPVLAAAAVTGLIAAGTLHRVDRWVQDWLYQRRGVPSGEIVIIGIDDETLAELGPYGPSYRSVAAYALEKLASDPEALPAAVAIDVLYEDESGTAGDEKLAQAAEKLGNVVTAVMAQYGDVIEWENGRAVSRKTAVVKLVEPYEALRKVTAQGHINAMADMDGILRHALLYVDTPDGGQMLSMAAQTAKTYMEKKGREFSLPAVNAGGHFYVSFTGKPGDYYEGYSVYKLLMGQLPSAVWKDKLVLIGPYAAALGDDYFTAASKGMKMFGVEYQANVIQSLLSGKLKTDIPDGLQLLAVFLLCAVAAYFFFEKKIWIGGAICGGLVLLGFAAPLLLYLLGFISHVLWLPVAAMVLYLAAVVWHYIVAARERHALALEKERIATELELATRIQANYLPKTFPERQEFDLFASMTPAKEVGGDLYDFFLVDDDHLCMVIGDVSGKGVPASLFMMLASALIHHVAMHEISPAKILTAVNEEVCARNPEEMFVTVWLAMLELSTGVLTASSAGHEYPAVKQPDGSFELFKDKHGFVIGGMEGVRYREYKMQLSPGSKVFVYTDGVPEATNNSDELFGTDRMIAALRTGENGSPAEILETVRASVAEFVGTAKQFDDLTMLCVAYHGAPEPEPEATAEVSEQPLSEG